MGVNPEGKSRLELLRRLDFTIAFLPSTPAAKLDPDVSFNRYSSGPHQ